jgi:hypothetical protein
VTEAAWLERFKTAYRGTNLEVRLYRDSITSWRWQLGSSNGDGHFVLLAFAATPDAQTKPLSSERERRRAVLDLLLLCLSIGAERQHRSGAVALRERIAP